MIKYICG